MLPGRIRVFLRPSSTSSCTPLNLTLSLTRICHSQLRTRAFFWSRSRFTMAMAAVDGGGGVNYAPPPSAGAAGAGPGTKRSHPGGQRQNKFGKKMRSKQKKPVQEGSHDEVLLMDVQTLLAASKISDDGAAAADSAVQPPLPEQGSEIEVDVVEMSSTGDGLAKQKGSDQIYVVPFAVPGDTVKVKVYRHLPDEGYTVADFISVTKPSPLRDDSRIQCKYFAKCSGCQFQMLDYAEQLRRKRQIVVKAYRNFSQLPPELVPDVLDTIGSPLQYNYRTKLTPHFDGPPGGGRHSKKPHQEMPPFGFTPKTSRRILDIEDCPIATETVRKGITQERERLAVEFGKYTRGATILLRESTQRVPKSQNGSIESAGTQPSPPAASVVVETDTYTDYKTVITDQNATSTEYIDDFIFTNPAGAFFQNNNSILPPFTAYIREHILPPAGSSGAKPVRNLIDAYSGSGLFTITQAALFPGGSIGIDIAEKSIQFARRNAELNGLVAMSTPSPSPPRRGSRSNSPPAAAAAAAARKQEEEAAAAAKGRYRFIAADAPELFKSVARYDPDETVVVLDPPRKGCDASFLRQLLQFAPRRVVYVSCNVHTQARDVGVLVRGEVEDVAANSNNTNTSATTAEGEANTVEAGEDNKKKNKTGGVRYEIESIRGFDFFPQTGHVEGVAILNRVDAGKE
ncbi:S-adenosyl-L-methionine-dependent methyltransferase [Lasiosphaeria ovina]|uniref:S-adenosyl-L-methionine-dependent methyltransferase n=1 Tax=Lasiosphaeria ovina TaxID=92902 RepID=A0AAE0K7Y1_9PEZI|nr:S-adenosyl-L-methionine-dependent methyltransferase [Lasiosphaeria ovina]